MSSKTLIIGACGQVGTELALTLREKYGSDSVIATDIRTSTNKALMKSGPFETLDVMDSEALLSLVKREKIHTVYHLAALLSATAEQKPQFGWDLNMVGLFNVLNLARDGHISRIFWPSSIAVFGPGTPKENTPQDCVMDPNTVYGISKLAGERWCEYYHARYGVDVRSLRYPGLISYKAKPGGGTTDYAVEIFYEALKKGEYTCFLAPDTTLPMLYMEDAIKATIDITEAYPELIKVRSSYNLAGFSFNPKQLAEQIQKHLPNFEMNYHIDFRQKIASGWPQSINDSSARQDWGWKNAYSLEDMVGDMLHQLKNKVQLD